MFHMLILMVELDSCSYSCFEWVQSDLHAEIHPCVFSGVQHADLSGGAPSASFCLGRKTGISTRDFSDLVQLSHKDDTNCTEKCSLLPSDHEYKGCEAQVCRPTFTDIHLCSHGFPIQIFVSDD